MVQNMNKPKTNPEVDAGKALRIIMAARNITNEELAIGLELKTPMTISYYRKQKSLSQGVVTRLANYFDMTVPEFLNISLIIQ